MTTTGRRREDGDDTTEPNTGRRNEDGDDTTEPNTGRRNEDGDDTTEPDPEPEVTTLAVGEDGQDPGFGRGETGGESPTAPGNTSLAVDEDGEDPGFGRGRDVEPESASPGIGEGGDDTDDLDRTVLDDAPEFGEFSLDDATLEPDTTGAVDSFEEVLEPAQDDGHPELVMEDLATTDVLDDGLIEE